MKKDMTKDGKWLIVYDLDHTLTLGHSEGDEVRKWFEKPFWRSNLRCYETLREHVHKMKKHCRLSVGTFGWWYERVEGYRDALWLKKEELLMHATFVDREKFPQQGKNEHIVQLLKKHYADKNACKIIGVLLVEDSKHNIKCLSTYDQYVQFHHPNDPRLQVQVKYEYMQPPECIKKWDETLQCDVLAESYTTHSFIRTLERIEARLAPEPKEEDEFIIGTPEDSFESTSSDSPQGFFRARLTSSACGYEHIDRKKVQPNRQLLIQSK